MLSKSNNSLLLLFYLFKNDHILHTVSNIAFALIPNQIIMSLIVITQHVLDFKFLAILLDFVYLSIHFLAILNFLLIYLEFAFSLHQSHPILLCDSLLLIFEIQWLKIIQNWCILLLIIILEIQLFSLVMLKIERFHLVIHTLFHSFAGITIIKFGGNRDQS